MPCSLIIDDNTSTGVKRHVVQADGEEKIYDLSGRRILSQPRRKGVYVVDGKKLFVK